ncbi:MAG: hypothetical protein LAO05_00190 [Acidobacteriia bacterium]|nr:hypothetical protein [Terriglobia bacterium]
MRHGRRNWLAWGVLATGAALRIGLAVVMPPGVAYDDHFTPIRALLKNGRLPRPDECWQCYQPPLFYVISGGVFTGVSRAAAACGLSEEGATGAAKKAVQLESAVFGCLTLLVCWAILRRVVPAGCPATSPHDPAPAGSGGGAPPGRARESARIVQDHPPEGRPKQTLTHGGEALALALAAFLPQHIYMSAMVTNDALTYLVASLAVWAALRAHTAGWPIGAALLTGALCGLAVLSKAYGMATAAAVLGTVGLAAVTRIARPAAGGAQGSVAGRGVGRPSHDAAPQTPGRYGRAVMLVAAGALTVGIWPIAGNLRLYGKPHVDNFDFFKTGMQTQPPGSLDAVEWLTFRPVALLQHPWVHTSTVDSIWTELYARLWFEYEGIISLKNSPQWSAFQTRVLRGAGGWTAAAWRELLSYGAGDVPVGLGWWARASYAAGLPLTAIVLAGFATAVAHRRRFGPVLLLLHFCGCLCVPLVQTLRLPHLASMKSAFALSAISSAPVFGAMLLVALVGRRRTLVAAVGWAATAMVALADVGYLVAQLRP